MQFLGPRGHSKAAPRVIHPGNRRVVLVNARLLDSQGQLANVLPRATTLLVGPGHLGVPLGGSSLIHVYHTTGHELGEPPHLHHRIRTSTQDHRICRGLHLHVLGRGHSLPLLSTCLRVAVTDDEPGPERELGF